MPRASEAVVREADPLIGAAVDVGSNSLHLLVAEIGPSELLYLRDESVLLDLGGVVDQHGALPPEARKRVLDSLAAQRQVAVAEGARTFTIVGTDPIRRAANADQLGHELKSALGLPLHVLDNRLEAELTYLGVTGGRPVGEPSLIADIGGGSTELILTQPGGLPQVHSLASGSARLANGILLNDPPTPNEFDRLRMAARSLVQDLPSAQVASATLVGGSATNLARLVPLTRDGLEQAHALLTGMSPAELVERYGFSFLRARQLPAGAAIVEAIFARFELESATASEASLRDGAILAAESLGPDWPARLNDFLTQRH